MLVCLKLYKGGRRQANDIKVGGRLDLYDILLLTICKLHKHVICEINNECIINEKAWLTVCKRLTLSGPAFSVVRQARGGGAQRPGCQKSKLTSTD